MAKNCRAMDEIVDGLGPELSEAEQAAIQEHLESCPLCRAQFRRMGLIVRYLSVPPSGPPTGQPHLSDLDLAAFAHARFGAEDAGRIVSHLTQCPECRQVLAAVRLAMDDYERRQAGRGLNWDELRDEIAVALSTPRRAVRLFGAAAAYVAECLMLAVALGQLMLGYAISHPDYWTVPDWWPLGLIPEGQLRLWVLVFGCGVGAALMRVLAARLYRGAVGTPSRGRGPQ